MYIIGCQVKPEVYDLESLFGALIDRNPEVEESSDTQDHTEASVVEETKSNTFIVQESTDQQVIITKWIAYVFYTFFEKIDKEQINVLNNKWRIDICCEIRYTDLNGNKHGEWLDIKNPHLDNESSDFNSTNYRIILDPPNTHVFMAARVITLDKFVWTINIAIFIHISNKTPTAGEVLIEAFIKKWLIIKCF